MSEFSPTALILIGHGSREPEGVREFLQLARTVQTRIAAKLFPCFLEFHDPPIAEAVRRCVEEGHRQVVVLPLFLGPANHQKNDIPALLNWARAQWSEVEFRYAAPLGVQYALLRTLDDRCRSALRNESLHPQLGSANGLPAERPRTAVALIGRGTSDPDSNSDVAKIARLLEEGWGYEWVEYGFYSIAQPGVTETLERCIRLGAERIVVAPFLLFSGRIHQGILRQAKDVAAAHPNVEVCFADLLRGHPDVIEAILQRYAEAVAGHATMTCDLCKYRHRMLAYAQDHGTPQYSDHRHGMRGVPHTHGMERLNALLPPRYRGGQPVSAAPMAAAPLVFDEEGRVAWDRIWGVDDPENPFCELALAGGPPHRGELLEPVDPQEALSDPEGCARVAEEIGRGVRMTTGLHTVPSRSPGWLGIQCESEEMAIWLLRAIVVENIAVRREGCVLYVPVGPRFRLEYEIKNVVTAVAKTHHYWSEHLLEQASQ
ncbi:MAG: sirohydrochlorin chelatase [Caldilinea sp.]|nr:sirohydrochlorin chelatase [Caldilinea sp.]MDW8441569.1 sirohydrochlorin chelatase [Caldilineaceae bacterium]